MISKDSNDMGRVAYHDMELPHPHVPVDVLLSFLPMSLPSICTVTFSVHIVRDILALNILVYTYKGEYIVYRA